MVGDVQGEQVAVVARVSGRVQGVNFRAHVAAHARRLGLAGWCRNLPDWTTVEVYAEGQREQVEQLLNLLWEGPGLARVEDVKVEWRDPLGGLDGFDVRW